MARTTRRSSHIAAHALLSCPKTVAPTLALLNPMRLGNVVTLWIKSSRRGLLLAGSRAMIGALLLVAGWLGGCRSDPPDRFAEAYSHAEIAELTALQRAVIGAANEAGLPVFGSIRAVALHADSLLAVADGMSQEVHVFDTHGEHLHTLAGDGEGPGRAKAIRSVSYARDGSLCMWDRQLGRISRLGPDGSAMDTWRPAYERFSLFDSMPLGFAAGCSIAVFRDRIRPDFLSEFASSSSPIRQVVDTILYTRVDQQGSAEELSRAAAPAAWLVRSEGMNAVHEVILGERLHAALVGTGSAPLDLTQRECNAQGRGREFSPNPGSRPDGKEVNQAVFAKVQVHGRAGDAEEREVRR